MVMPMGTSSTGKVWGRRSAARRIQKAWKAKKARQRDNIKTKGDVKKAVQSFNPSSVIAQETAFALTTTPVVQQSLSNIEFSNSNDRPNSRKSLKITVGHFKLRCRLQVGDATNLCRVMVVRNKNPLVSAAFAPSQMFEINNGIGTQPNNMFAEPNLREVEVKYDRVFNLQSTSESAPATRVQDIYWDFKVPIHETFKYLTVANNTNELTRNMKDYYIVAFSDSSITPNPRFTCVSYTWFKNIGNTA